MFKLSPQQKRTRQRGKNFSPSEEMMLMELLQPYKEIINNKRSDAATCQMKKTAWEQLASQFSIQTGMSRSWRTLKDKYKNMNTKMKIEGKRVPGSMLSQDMDESAGSCVSVVYNQESAQKYAKTFAQAPHPAFSFGGEGDSFANTFSRRVEEEEVC
ncbi:hypothetical protein KR018_002068 [Drosophila ironensis]|nr:hypothetical protein KR018_002068 [Drosophila ironensis]